MMIRRIFGRHSIPFLVRWALQRSVRLATAGMRTLPDFAIIGGQRCGTTSLYNYLVEHPLVSPAFMKETHFFDLHYHKGLGWYRSFFPCSRDMADRQGADRRRLITGESSPSYLFYPYAPQRMARTIPQVRLIALLRNPVERAHSHYYHEVRLGFEDLGFEDALLREEKELPAEAARVLQDEAYLSFAYWHHSYLTRGIYIDQLERWTQWFDREQILVLKSEDLAREPAAILERVAEFCGLPSWSLPVYKQYHLAQYPPMDAATRRGLVGFFQPHNQRLYEFLGMDLGWE